MGKDEGELRSLLAAAIERPGPVAIRYPRGSGQGLALPDEIADIEWGRAEWLRHGRDLTLIGLGPIVYEALAAADVLAERGYDVGVVNARFVKPLDIATLRAVSLETNAVLTLEEHALAGGFGSCVTEWAQSEGIAVPIRSAGLPDEFIDQGPPSYFLEHYGLTRDGIVQRVCDWIGRG